jgi:hypothetical protein
MGIQRTKKAVARRREAAKLRKAERAKRTDEQQLKLIESRRGESKRERAFLEA